MNRRIALLGLVGILFSGCSLFNKDQQAAIPDTEPKKEQQENWQQGNPYQATTTKLTDLVHTKLDVRPDWENQYLHGEAELTFTPYFYPQDSLVIDAKGFDIHEVELMQGGNRKAVNYQYDNLALTLNFNQTYQKTDTFKVYIDYTAKPEELTTEGSDAITGAQGLYFINPEGKKENIPRQIWTQGEPEASSCWFPTIDKPNQKTTQEIAITVDTGLKTLSNGTRSYSILNDDGTRTDKWKMEKPHAPYLFMMAIGDYAVVEDDWRGKEVNYYVEPEYEPYAEMIFGRTPEMMTLFSELFDYDYPWSKYSQVPVRNFVAGAMENTTATIHFDRIQHNKREHIDQDYESLIAHELIHHWFGNLVTCESWANLALNESFATYGQYLWYEHAYGDDRAAMSRHSAYNTYLNEARSRKRPLIQHHYQNPGQLFDRHRYQKGSVILHMLRNYVGDSAFFQGVNHYLEDRAYRPAEYHHLRLALEEVSGKDLNWFFDQWFESAGHPKLRVSTEYNPDAQEVRMIVEQTHETEQYPVFKLPVAVDVYQNGSPTRHQVTIENRVDTFHFPSATKPNLVNFDAEKILLAEVDFSQMPEKWIYQFRNAPHYLDRYRAIDGVKRNLDTLAADQAAEFFREVMNAEFMGIRKHGFTLLEDMEAEYGNIGQFRNLVINKALNDPASDVRNKAFQSLSLFQGGESLNQAYRKGLNDSSYKVVRTALSSLARQAPDVAMEEAKNLENADHDQLRYLVARLYAGHGDLDKKDYIEELLQTPGFPYRFQLAANYSRYLRQRDLETQLASVPVWESLVRDSEGTRSERLVQKFLTDLFNYHNQRLSTKQGEKEDGSPEQSQREELVQKLKSLKQSQN